MKKTSRVLLFLIAFVGSACVLQAGPPANAPAYASAPRPTDGNALLYIYRIGAFPTARLPDVVIDESVVFRPPERAYTWMHLSAGRHRVRLDWEWDTGAPDLDFVIDVQAGQDHFLKITGSLKQSFMYNTWGSQAGLVVPDYALREIATCRYMGWGRYSTQ